MCLERQVETFPNIPVDHEKNIGKKKDHNLGLHLKFYILWMSRLIGLLFQPG